MLVAAVYFESPCVALFGEVDFTVVFVVEEVQVHHAFYRKGGRPLGYSQFFGKAGYGGSQSLYFELENCLEIIFQTFRNSLVLLHRVVSFEIIHLLVHSSIFARPGLQRGLGGTVLQGSEKEALREPLGSDLYF